MPPTGPLTSTQNVPPAKLFTSSVLIPSYNRPAKLQICLEGIARGTTLPTEVIVVWQGDDTPTGNKAKDMQDKLPYPLIVLHNPVRGVVPAENMALAAAKGEVILLIDDDAIPAETWLAKHLAFYQDPRVGAVGGPAANIFDTGLPGPRRTAEPIGVITWYGRVLGNMYDHDPSWRTRPPREVDHLVGYNMSLRRMAFERFAEELLPYWQYFEFDACRQVAERGYKIMFDFSNEVEHHPTNTAYVGGRGGDLTVKVYNNSFNLAFNISRHSRGWKRIPRWLFVFLFGNSNTPGPLILPMTAWKYGQLWREWGIVRKVFSNKLRGWRAGLEVQRRRLQPAKA